MSFSMALLFTICLLIISSIYMYLRKHRRGRSQEKQSRPSLEVLYSPTAGDAEVDVVAVHGLGANVDWSWVWQDKTGQRSPVHWLRNPDMLPAVVPKARILAYNYESRWHINAPQLRLQLCGKEFMRSLHNFRSKESKRPIVFIGHSLGGLVILYGLLDAHEKDELKHLPENTVGFVSLGTPFRGTDMQPIAQLATWIMAPFHSHWGIIADLSYDNANLRDKMHTFGELVEKFNIPVHCFFELYKTDYGKRFGIPDVIKGMVVKEASACVPGWPNTPLETDHLKINKFADPNDRAFQAVSAEITKMCNVEPIFKKAVNYLHDKCYDESKLRIERLSGAISPMNECFINLAIVENVQLNKAAKKESEKSGKPSRDFFLLPTMLELLDEEEFGKSSPFSLLARQKVETPNEKLQVSLTEIFNPRGEFNTPENPPRRILIRGRAGVGKTTLCKKIIHDFIKSNTWRNLFDCILWVPLRNLRQRSGSGYNLERLLWDEFFSGAGNKDGGRFISEGFDAVRHHHKSVLFILDGWDEVAQLGDDDYDMFTFIKELLNSPNVIITSRPSARLPSGFNVHLELETIGFYPEQVDEYITKNQKHHSDEIKSFLQGHHLVKSLTRIPIQLDALCHCWEDVKAHYGDAKSQTMTTLYEAIQTSLWKKDIPQLTLGWHEKQIKPSEIVSADQQYVEWLVQRELHYLEHLAFDGLINNVLEFKHQDHLNLVNYDENYRLRLDSLLPRLSFLRSPNPSAQTTYRSYHFIHLTFQEYFAARYFSRQWKQDSVLKSLISKKGKDATPKDFLAKYKYDQRFNIMWRFVAGLLDVVDMKGEHQATRFLKTIEEEPRDLIGPAHQRLVMYCLNEVVSSGGSDFSTFKERLEERLTRWLVIEYNIINRSSLAVEPEFPEKAIEKILKQGSEQARNAIIMALNKRTTPPATLNADGKQQKYHFNQQRYWGSDSAA
ncbi:peptidase C14 [Trichoderma chlorosporum]